MPKVALVMGSQSDFPVLQDFIITLKQFDVEVVTRVLSAHRTPVQAAAFAESAAGEGIEVICAAAGKAAHLGGVLAAHTCLPVIGIPLKSSELDGMDALLSTVQMPPGVPVATVGINAAQNAALLAVQMLQLKYPQLAEKLAGYKKSLTEKVLSADEQVRQKALELGK